MGYGYLFGSWQNESKWSTWVYWHLKMAIKRSKQYGLVLICSRVDQKRLPLLNNCPFPMANKKKYKWWLHCKKLKSKTDCSGSWLLKWQHEEE
jgi:hypothetical protein